MKLTTIFCLMVLFVNTDCAGQQTIPKHNIHGGFTRNFYGNFLSLNYTKNIKKSSLSVGLHYLINNKYNPDAKGYWNYHRYHAYNTIQHFSPSLQYSRKILPRIFKYNEFYFFANTQFLASGTKRFDVTVRFSYYDSITQQKKYYNKKMDIEDKDITYGINNCIGLGLKAHLTNYIFFNLQFGFSNLTYNNKYLDNNRYWEYYDFGTFFQISTGYSFNTKATHK